jgi:putative aldouronate transport system permease protein
MNQFSEDMMSVMADGDDMISIRMKIASMIKYAVIIVSSIPVLIIYPFLQKYFASGVMLGALKG